MAVAFCYQPHSFLFVPQAMNTREAYIALNAMRGVGPATVRALTERLGCPERIFDALEEEILTTPGLAMDVVRRIAALRGQADPVGECERAERAGATLLTPVDAAYPRRLAGIHDPPMALYVWGKIESRDDRAVAVVGSRRTTHYGMETAERLAFQLAQSGFTVVSGLARGIDTAAHRGALKAGGRTLAVLGGGLDCLFPPENRDLAEAISRQGAVLTEYPFGRQPDKTTFPVRNRIVAGLSMGVVVVEAGLTSGAMITAQVATEEGRTVFAVPGRVDAPGSKGPHRLLRDGARLVEDVEDILQEFDQLIPTPRSTTGPKGSRPPLSGDEAKIVGCLEREMEADVDALIRQTGLSPASVSALLLGLEMKRVVRMLPGRRVALRAGRSEGGATQAES